MDRKRLKRALQRLLDGDRLDLWVSGGELWLMPDSRIWFLSLPKVRGVEGVLAEFETERPSSKLSLKSEKIWGEKGFSAEFWVDSKFWGLLGYLLRRGMLGDSDVVFTASYFKHWGWYGQIVLTSVGVPSVDEVRVVVFSSISGGSIRDVQPRVAGAPRFSPYCMYWLAEAIRAVVDDWPVIGLVDHGLSEARVARYTATLFVGEREVPFGVLAPRVL